MPITSPAHVGADAPADDIALDDIVSFDAFLERFPHIANEPRLRWWIFHRKANGLAKSGALVKKGGRWFIVAPRLRAWLLNPADDSL